MITLRVGDGKHHCPLPDRVGVELGSIVACEQCQAAWKLVHSIDSPPPHSEWSRCFLLTLRRRLPHPRGLGMLTTNAFEFACLAAASVGSFIAWGRGWGLILAGLLGILWLELPDLLTLFAASAKKKRVK